MGMSDEDRIRGICFCIQRLEALNVDLVAEKQRDNGYPYPYSELYSNLENKINDLWHLLLGNLPRSVHWGSDQLITADAVSPWAVAIQYHMPQVNYDWKPGTPVKWATDNSVDSLCDDSECELFDPFDSGFLTIPALLGRVRFSGPFYAIVFKIYQELEQMAYFACYYRDGLSSQFKSLIASISAMQGSCFSLFYREEDFTKAYVLHNVCKLLFGNINPFSKDQNDVVTLWAVNQHLYHDIPSVMNEWTLQDIAALHLHMVHHKDNLVERVLGLLQLLGKRYHYKHNYRELQEMIADHPEFKARAKLRINKQVSKCLGDYEQSKKTESAEILSDDRNAQTSIYGYYGE